MAEIMYKVTAGVPVITDAATFLAALPLTVTPITTTGAITVGMGLIVCNHATVAITVTLPTLASSTNVMFTIKNKGAAVTTVEGNGSETIDGALNVTLNQYDSVAVINDATQWLII